jgi:nitrate/nitrite transporter NarK
MLPMAAPLFVVPRLVSMFLTHRFSGRALLTLGMLLVFGGMVWLTIFARRFDYELVLAGMLIAGLGAGILNGEIAKVGMTVIPPERAGMAAGVSGTMRFSGIVVGFAALGAVLVLVVTAVLFHHLPDMPISDRQALVQRIVAGGLPSADLTGRAAQAAKVAFAEGYQAIFFVAALCALAAATATWLLVKATDTAPVQKSKDDIATAIALID